MNPKQIHDPELEAVLEAWLKRSRESQILHYAEANRLEKQHRLLAVILIILASVAGITSTSLVPRFDPIAKVTAGLASFAAAILAGIQGVLKWADRAEQHKNAAVNFGIVRRKIELFLVQPADQEKDFEYSAKLREEIDGYVQRAPRLPNDLWESPPAPTERPGKADDRPKS